jgi:hypothetical protein
VLVGLDKTNTERTPTEVFNFQTSSVVNHTGTPFFFRILQIKADKSQYSVPFHRLFSLPEHEILIDNFACQLKKKKGPNAGVSHKPDARACILYYASRQQVVTFSSINDMSI